jgi:hypothetical protein
MNSGFQSAITHAPRFLLGTYIRDNMTRMFIPRYQGIVGRIPLAQDAIGIYNMMFNRSFYRAYAQGGGIRGGIYSHAANEASEDALKAAAASSGFMTRTLDQMEAQRTFLGKGAVLARVPGNAIIAGKNYATSLVDRIRYGEGALAKGIAVITTPGKMMGDALRLVEMSETASRLGGAKLTFDYLKKQGLNDIEALNGALYEARDVLNYNSHGSWMTRAARVFPFLQAGITGADRSARGLIAEPVMAAYRAMERGGYANLDVKDKAILSAAWKNWLYIGAAAGAGSAIYYPWAQGTEFYRRASDYMRRTYFLLQTGQDKDGNPIGLTIHKGYDIPAALMTTAELFSQEVRKHDPVNWSRVMSGLTEAVPRQFRSLTSILESAPGIKTAYEVNTGMKMGAEDRPPTPIVPDALKALPPEKQIGAMSSAFSKWIGEHFHVSPLVVDHVVNGMGGTSGTDIRDLATAVFDNNPLITTKDALNRFFFGQVYRTARTDVGSNNDLKQVMARNHGEYQIQANAYRDALERGEKDEADALYNRADDSAKTLMTLQSSRSFKPDDRELHPLVRSETIANVVYGMMRNLGKNEILVQDRSHKRGEERTIISLSQEQSRLIYAQLNSILAEETRNGLAMAGHPGYEDFSVIDTHPRVEIMRKISPEVAHEFDVRIRAAHVLPALGVSQVWLEAEHRLLADQRSARLGDLVGKAKAFAP